MCVCPTAMPDIVNVNANNIGIYSKVLGMPQLYQADSVCMAVLGKCVCVHARVSIARHIGLSWGCSGMCSSNCLGDVLECVHCTEFSCWCT